MKKKIVLLRTRILILTSLVIIATILHLPVVYAYAYIDNPRITSILYDSSDEQYTAFTISGKLEGAFGVALWTWLMGHFMTEIDMTFSVELWEDALIDWKKSQGEFTHTVYQDYSYKWHVYREEAGEWTETTSMSEAEQIFRELYGAQLYARLTNLVVYAKVKATLHIPWALDPYTDWYESDHINAKVKPRLTGYWQPSALTVQQGTEGWLHFVFCNEGTDYSPNLCFTLIMSDGVEVIDYTVLSPVSYSYSPFPKGYTMWNRYGYQITIDHKASEWEITTDLSSGGCFEIKVKVKFSGQGSQWIQQRVTMRLNKKGGGDSPTYVGEDRGVMDQQGWYSIEGNCNVEDDDTTPPSYSGQTTSPSGTMYDSHSGSIRLQIDWEDTSGIYQVKFKYKYGSGSFTSWRSPTSSSGKTYWYDIPRSEWINHIDKTIYWESYATDNDDTRETEYTPTFTGPTLRDDDTSGPSFSSPTSTGDINEDYPGSYRIGITVKDSSDVYVVKFKYKFDGSWSSWYSSSGSSGSEYWYDISRSKWSQHVPSTVYYQVYAEDDDKDRSNDRESATSQEYTAGNILEKPDEPQLSVSPTLLDFGTMNPGETDQKSFTVKNVGTGTLTWQASESCSWVTSVSPSSGSLGEDQPQSVTVYISTSGLSWDQTYTCQITVTSNNGTKTVTVKVTTPQEPTDPELSVSPTLLDFGTMNPGETDQKSFTVKNVGTGTLTWQASESCSWVTSVSPSSGSLGEDQPQSVTVYISTSGLSWDQTYTCQITVTSNNGTKTVTVKVDIPEGPQLTCSVRVDRSDGVYYVGDPVVIYYSVSEICDGTLTIYTPDRTLQYDFSGISPGVEHSFSGTAGYPTGRRDVVFDVWKGSQSASASCVFYVYDDGENHPPVLSDGQVDPPTGYPDTTFTFWVRYYDQDNDPAVMKRIYVYSNGWYSFDMHHHSGDPLSGEWFYIPLYESEGWSPGSHNFYFQFSDGQFEVREPTSGYLTFTIGSVDLVISDVSWSPSSLKEGDTVTFTVTIKNQGTVDAGYFKTAYYIDGVKKGEWSISSLSSGQTTSKAFTWTSVEGSHTVKAFADSSYNIQESDENNNRREESFSVSGKPDLIVSDVSWSPSSLKEGDTVTFTTKIKNQGTESASSFKTAYYIDGVKKGEWSMSSLNAGQTVTKTFIWTAVEGSHTVKTFTDSSYNIPEKDENNNQREESFSVSGKPDLKILDITWNPATPIEDERVTFTVTIENQGTVRAGSFKVTYHIDGVKLGEWDIYGLSASQTTAKTFTWTAIEGSHTVKAFADSSYNVDEKEETNNERQETIQVAPKPKPDLVISDISWSPTSPVESDTVTFTVTIKNQGAADAGRFKVAYYIDDVKKGEWTIYSLSADKTTSKTFTWTAVEGSHTVKAFADSDEAIMEEYETNNGKEEAFEVGPKPMPDLVISSVSWTPEKPVEGKTVTFTVTIKNQGTANTGSFKASYYIDGTKKGEWSLSSLSTGQTVTRSFTWSAVKGDHTVKAFADSSYNVDEEVETNNEREETLIGPKPDLMVPDISWNPTNSVEDDTITFTVTIENQGTASTGSFKVAYYLDDVKKGELSMTSLSAGQTAAKTFTWTAVEGSHTVKVFADSNNDVEENDETNNERQETFQVGPKPKPNLRITDILWTPASPVEGDTITFTVSIENQGGADAGRFQVTYYIDGTNLGEWTIYSLSSAETTSKTFTWTAVEDGHTVKAVADSNDDITEEDETNNEREETLQVGPAPKPDLIISDISWSPTTPVEDEKITYSVTIENNDTVSAGSFKVAYYIDGVEKGEWTIYSLSSGSTTTKTFTWTAIEGNHTVKACADSNNVIIEENEANNCKEETLQVGPKPKPDVIVSDISWSPVTPIEGEAVTFTVTIENNDTVSAGSFKATYYIDDVKEGEWSIYSLSAGSTTTKTFAWTAVEGTHTVKVYADSNEAIAEEEEANNEREETFQVGPKPKPDLVISSISWNPADPVEGDTITFTVTIENNDTVNAGRFKVAYYIDDVEKGEWTIYSLSSGKTTSKTFSWTAVEGSHSVRVCADLNDDVSEEDETNNEREESFQVGPKPKPDLVVSDISWTPENPVEGDTVTLTVTIKNQGEASAGSFKVAYYIDDAKLGEWSIFSLSAGQEVNKTFTWTYAGGSHTVKAFADSNEDIEEEVETNNEREEVVGNQPPVASFCCNNGYNYLNNSIVFMCESTCFNASESYDPEGTIVSYTWDFGDGNITTVTDPIVHHNCTDVGIYTVTLNVTDDQGLWDKVTATVKVTLLGDLNDDGEVNIIDISIVARAFGTKPGDLNWNATADLNNDEVINIIDISVVARQFGKKP